MARLHSSYSVSVPRVDELSVVCSGVMSLWFMLPEWDGNNARTTQNSVHTASFLLMMTCQK